MYLIYYREQMPYHGWQSDSMSPEEWQAFRRRHVAARRRNTARAWLARRFGQRGRLTQRGRTLRHSRANRRDRIGEWLTEQVEL